MKQKLLDATFKWEEKYMHECIPEYHWEKLIDNILEIMESYGWMASRKAELTHLGKVLREASFDSRIKEIRERD